MTVYSLDVLLFLGTCLKAPADQEGQTEPGKYIRRWRGGCKRGFQALGYECFPAGTLSITAVTAWRPRLWVCLDHPSSCRAMEMLLWEAIPPFHSCGLPPSLCSPVWFSGWPSPVTSLGQQPRCPSEPSSDRSLHVCQEPVSWALSEPPGWNFVMGCVCMCVLVVWEGLFHRGLRQSQLLCGGPPSHPSLHSDSHCSWPKLQTSSPVFPCTQGIWVNQHRV